MHSGVTMKADLAKHHKTLREIGCILTGRPKPDLHHCKTGSISKILGVNRGVSSKVSDWLVIPLDQEFHTGRFGIEVIGVETWESQFGTQIDHLEAVYWRTGIDVLRMAGVDKEFWFDRRLR